jgi:hypothetical protein
MRSVIYNYLKTLTFKSFTLSDKIPWEDNKGPLYEHNKKHIYVGVATVEQSPLIDAFNHQGTIDEITTISVYFVNDAKQLPTDYDSAVASIKEARLATGTEGYIQRTCQVKPSFIDDNLLTEFVFSFRKLLTN